MNPVFLESFMRDTSVPSVELKAPTYFTEVMGFRYADVSTCLMVVRTISKLNGLRAHQLSRIILK